MPVEGRGLSSRQTQYVVKNLGDWATYQVQMMFRKLPMASHAKDGVSLVREPDAGNLHVRFDERDVETEPWSNH